MGRLLLGMLPQIILKWPRSVQRGGPPPPLDFDGTRNARSPAQHFAADGTALFLYTLGAVAPGVESRIRIVGIFRAETAHSKDGALALTLIAFIVLMANDQPSEG
jgi:hypothetical protein